MLGVWDLIGVRGVWGLRGVLCRDLVVTISLYQKFTYSRTISKYISWCHYRFAPLDFDCIVVTLMLKIVQITNVGRKLWYPKIKEYGESCFLDTFELFKLLGIGQYMGRNNVCYNLFVQHPSNKSPHAGPQETYLPRRRESNTGPVQTGTGLEVSPSPPPPPDRTREYRPSAL